MSLHNKDLLKQDGVFYRMKYSRMGVISSVSIQASLGILINIFIFNVFLILAFILLILVYMYSVHKVFSKHIFSIVRFHLEGIEWIYKGEILYNFKWDDIIDIRKGSFMLNATFELILPNEIIHELNIKKFEFNCYEELRTYIVENTSNSFIVEKVKDFDLRY